MDRMFFKVAEFAQLSNCSNNHIYSMVQKGTISAARFGRAIRIPRVELDRFIEARDKCQCRDSDDSPEDG